MIEKDLEINQFSFIDKNNPFNDIVYADTYQDE